MSYEVRDNRALQRYEIFEGGTVLGFSTYKIDGDQISMLHTEIDKSHGGKGLGSILVRGALDDARGRNLAVLPFCRYVRAFIAKNREEYLGLVPESRRNAFEL